VTVTGTAEVGAAVTISLDGSPAGTVTAAGDGTFSLAVAVAEGLRSFTATAADAAGNVSPQSNTVPVLVDRSLPAAPVLDPIESPTSDTTITVTGTAEPGATVAILVDGVQVATVVAAADGTFAAPLVLVEGSQVITATASNAAGTSPESSARTVVVDLAAPAAPIITAPAAGEALPAGTVLIEGSAEPGATVSVVVNGETLTAVAAADGSFSVSAVLPAGAWTATATATDAAENASPQADRSFTTVADGSGGVNVSGGGGCGCSPAGGASPAGLLLLPLALGLAPRRRRRAA
jgi:MYXO-CTERM domain-containing protein